MFKASVGKKRPAEFVNSTPAADKKARLVTPEKTGIKIGECSAPLKNSSYLVLVTVLPFAGFIRYHGPLLIAFDYV